MTVGKFVGFFILVVGAVLLLGNFGVIPHQSIGEMLSTLWPLLLIYWGVRGLWWAIRSGAGFWGSIWSIVLLLVGAGVLMQNLHLDIFPFPVWNLLIPVGFIIAGLSILFGKRRFWYNSTGIDFDWRQHRRDRRHRHRHHGHSQGVWAETMEDGRRHMNIAMGDVFIGGPDWHLENTTIDLKMGSVKVDLRETRIPEGETVIDLSCKAGDARVILPEGIPLWIEAGVKFGNVKLLEHGNSGMGTRLYKTDNYDTAERKIKMRISVKFGDVNVQQLG